MVDCSSSPTLYWSSVVYIVANAINPKLVETEQFTLGKYPFKEFNYLQTLCYPYHDKDCNLIVSAATSAGKTIVAELCVMNAISQNKKAIFLSPLKAVTQQKLEDWTDDAHYLSKNKIEIITGDHRLTEAKVKNIKESNLILMTSEMLDTRTRYISSENNSWIKEVGILVVDEAHLLTTNRGSALEVGLMRFAQINPSARIVLLSATMTNYESIGNWIEQLNNKQTAVVASSWRPVDLHYHKLKAPHLLDKTEQVLSILTCPDDELALHLISDKELNRTVAITRAQGGVENKKTLVFVHTKAMGYELEERLSQRQLKCHFHNADLDKSKRQKLEKMFKEELDILISTSTLAWGINLPAKNVIIVGDQRGVEKVSSMDIAQMCGRAGRFGMYDRGDVFLINCDVADKFEIKSQLANTIPFHIIAEFYSGQLKTKSDAIEWYKRSFANITTPEKASTIIENTFNDLIKYRAIVQDGIQYKVTAYGKIARDLYLHPRDIDAWRKNFNYIDQQKAWNNDARLAWAISNDITTLTLDYTPGPLKSLFFEFQNKLNINQSTKNSNMALGTILYYRLIRDRLDSFTLREFDTTTSLWFQLFAKDSGRIFNAINRVAALEGLNRENELSALQARIIHGVGPHLIELVSIPGVGGTIAAQLYKSGLKSLKDVLNNKDKLSQFITRKANVTRIINGLIELEEKIIPEEY